MPKVLLNVVSDDPGKRPISIAQMRQELQNALLAREEIPTAVLQDGIKTGVDNIRSLYRNTSHNSQRRILIGVGGATVLLGVGAVVWSELIKQLTLPPGRAGATLLTYTGHSDNIWSVAWSPDGKYIASASRDQTAQVWSVS